MDAFGLEDSRRSNGTERFQMNPLFAPNANKGNYFRRIENEPIFHCGVRLTRPFDPFTLSAP